MSDPYREGGGGGIRKGSWGCEEEREEDREGGKGGGKGSRGSGAPSTNLQGADGLGIQQSHEMGAGWTVVVQQCSSYQ